MKLRKKIILLALAPLVLALVALAIAVNTQSIELAKEQREVIEPAYLASKEAELKNYLLLAQYAIAPLYDSGRMDDATKAEAKAILARMNYGDDGYFFLYDLQGNLLVHPHTPERVGTNRLDYRDKNGFPHVRHLIARGHEGGGFVRYVIEKPSTGKSALKLTYVTPLPKWGWFLCTGIYLEDVEYVLEKVDTQVIGNNLATMRWIGSIAFLGMAAIIFFGLMLNIRGRREAEETERARLSSELHDGICQRLAAARMQASVGLIHLAGVPPAYVPAQAVFRNLEKDLKDVLRETREISHGLHPIVLRDLGLAAALRQLAQDMENDATLVRFRSRGTVEGLPDATTLAFYRLAQECLKNIRQHSQASRAVLRLAGNRRAVRLTAWDNGIGFDARDPECKRMRGLGLYNMKARVEEAGGQLTITSRPGSTKVTATIPRPFLQRFLPMRDLRSSD
ncbi:two-component system NarL family sensor kinase [Nitrosospira multiformis]|uniref:Two-component system NarL family sensor kinase n=1 Tax=Nitrosospira multiformis TaxID=1231 RepID=A0A2T5IGQ8_9PROT|nr:cache domain-containing protein [Nitrosospira multiformis]PTQ83008.1 two-component system NarL family sensor kinase [Nitrosospira multiformis]